MAAPASHNLGFQEVLQKLGTQPEGPPEGEASDRLIQSCQKIRNGK